MCETKIRIQDDLYEAVNGEWLKTAVIPEDRPAAGGFVELDQNVEKLMMADFRANPPRELCGSPVTQVIDYLEPEKTGQPSSNVLQFFDAAGDVVSVRPSGTEPKIKFYFGAKGDDADAKIAALKEQFCQ